MRAFAAAIGLALGMTVGCTDSPPLLSAGDDLTDAQRPARGSTDIHVWLDAGYYKSWHCEPEIHDARPGSPHGGNRICNNDVLHAAAAGSAEQAFPIDAAAVKEMYVGGTLSAYAVMRKVQNRGGGDSWYWYEGSPGHPSSNGDGVRSCVGCHFDAPRDFVYTLVP